MNTEQDRAYHYILSKSQTELAIWFECLNDGSELSMRGRNVINTINRGFTPNYNDCLELANIMKEGELYE